MKFKGKKLIEGKKAATSWALMTLGMLVLLAGLVWWQWDFFSGAAERGGGPILKVLDDFGDYDEDAIVNKEDKCPCIKYIGTSELEGCPPGTSVLDSDEDRRKYVEESCGEEAEAEAEEELVGDWGIKGFVLGIEEGVTEFDMGGEEAIILPFEFDVENKGSEGVKGLMGIEVCDLSVQECKSKQLTKMVGDSPGIVLEKLELDTSLKETLWILGLGKDDSCDCGESECSCYVVLSISSEGEEVDAEDNTKLIKTTLKNKKVG